MAPKSGLISHSWVIFTLTVTLFAGTMILKKHYKKLKLDGNRFELEVFSNVSEHHLKILKIKKFLVEAFDFRFFEYFLTIECLIVVDEQ